MIKMNEKYKVKLTYDIEAETMEDIDTYLDEYIAEGDDWEIEIIGNTILINKKCPMIVLDNGSLMEDEMDVVG